ncbi:hypothetical protein WJX72_007896 [[Myrmecia] bisecta]|uniref:Uncharacterized protein n=1 Tax=[Myrmecia] bisecta TaxID=41462 RepID=A0AAW1PEF5_9CHLO
MLLARSNLLLQVRRAAKKHAPPPTVSQKAQATVDTDQNADIVITVVGALEPPYKILVEYKPTLKQVEDTLKSYLGPGQLRKANMDVVGHGRTLLKAGTDYSYTPERLPLITIEDLALHTSCRQTWTVLTGMGTASPAATFAFEPKQVCKWEEHGRAIEVIAADWL